MSFDPLLAIPELDPAQTGKTVTLNAALQAFAKSISDTLTLAANSLTSPYTIPFDTTQDEPAGVKTALRFMKLNVTGAITADWTAYMPGGGFKHLFVAINNTTGGHNVIIKVSGQTGVTLTPGQAQLCYLNGTDVEIVGVSLNTWRTGSGAPSGGLGINGDFYLDTSGTGNLYQKVGGSWTLLGSILGPSGATGAQGLIGGAISIEYTFDTGTTNADPGAGKLRLNNATENIATAIYMNTSDDNAVDFTALLDTLDASSSAVKGQVRVVKKNDQTKWLTFNLTARVTHTGYRELTITNTASSAASPFAASDTVVFCFERTGDAASGLPAGGTTGQVLRKHSGTDYDTEWDDALFPIAMFFPGVPANNAIGRYIVTDTISLPSGLATSYAKAKTASTGTAVLNINQNGVSKGTITFTASATGTFSFSSTISFVAGDILEIAFPATADATLADIAITLRGTRS